MTESPLIEFPCDYPIKVIADAQEGLVEEVVSIFARHDPTVGMEKVTYRESRNGTYHSLTIIFWATGEPQLKRLFEDLKECEAVRMVL